MPNKAKIVFNTSKGSIGTVHKVAIESIASKLHKLGHDIYYDKKDNYSGYDIFFVFSGQTLIRDIKVENPGATVILLDPKYNNQKDIDNARLANLLLVSSLEQQETSFRYNNNAIIYNWFPKIKPIYKKHTQKRKYFIGYQGNKIHLHSMHNRISIALDLLKSEGYDMEFLAIYNINKLKKWTYGLPKTVPVRHIQWEEQTYCRYLSDVDIGIVPNLLPTGLFGHYFCRETFAPFIYNYHPQDFFLRFKMNSNPNRIYEFSQLGIPVVADMYPSTCQTINHGKTGFLAYGKEGWYKYLKLLLDDADLRNLLSKNLRKFVDSEISPEKNFNNLYDYLSNKLNLKL
jgi:hypothetical protein